MTPDWGNAIDYNKNGRSFLEIPITFAGNGTMSKSASSTATQFDPQTGIPVPTRLIISQSEQGSFEAHIMIIESTVRFPSGIVPEFNLFKKIDNFTGREILCYLDGSFYKGWRHEKGQIVSSLSLNGDNARQQPLRVRECWYWVLYDLGTGSIIRVLGLAWCDNPLFYDDQFNGLNPGGGTSSWAWPGNPRPHRPDQRLEDEDYLCGVNFEYTSDNNAATAIRQQAAISGLNAKFTYYDQNGVKKELTVQMPTLYFAMNYHDETGALLYTHQQAANYTAAMINGAENFMRDHFQMSGERDSDVLAQFWYDEISNRFGNNNPEAVGIMSLNAFMPTLPIIKPYNPC